MEAQRYRPSGKFGAGVLLVPAIGLAGALLGSLVYAYVNVYSPIFGITSIIATLLYGVGVGLCVGLGGKFGKVRNTAVQYGFGLAIGAFALYAQWAAFEAVLLSKEDVADAPGYLDLLADPQAVWDLANLINQTGWYTIKSSTPKGIVLWVFWGVEALAVIGTITACAGMMLSEVFCERCDDWCEDRDEIALPMPEDESVLERIARGDVQALTGLGSPAAGAEHTLAVEFQACAKCGECGGMDVSTVRRTTDDDGKESEDKDSLTGLRLLDGTAVRTLESLSGPATP